MKTRIAILAAVVLATLSAAPRAEARHPESRIYISGHLACGSPVYKERYFMGYDRCGNAVWGTRVVRYESLGYRARRPVAVPRYVEPCAPVYHAPRYRVSDRGRRGYQAPCHR